MKSKYGIYVLLFFVTYSVQMSAMKNEVEMSCMSVIEAVKSSELETKNFEVVEISESHKKWWHKACIHWALSHFLQETVPLSFEIIGSKKFIAQELRKKLDIKPGELIDLAMHRDAIFEVLKTSDKSNHFVRLVDSFKVLNQYIKPKLLLHFIVSLEDTIKDRIGKANRTVEIVWRKGAYKYFNSNTGYCLHVSSCRGGYCKHVQACLLLDIEKEFTLEELQSDDYVRS